MATEKKAPEEQEAVKAEATEQVEEKTEDGKSVYTFKKPITYNNRTYEKVTYDLDGLTGQDSMDVEEELVRLRKGIVIEGSLNTDYIIRIFCKACEEPIGADAFRIMSLADYNRIKTLTRNFLMKSGR